MNMRRLGADGVAVAPLWSVATSAPPAIAVDEQNTLVTAKRREEEFAAAMERGFQQGQENGQKQALEAARAQAEAWQQKRESELAQSRAQYDQARTSLETLAGAISAQISAEIDKAEELAVEVAYSAVVRMLGENYAGRELIPSLVRQALQGMVGNVDAIMLCKQDLGMLEDLNGIAVAVDPHLQPGQCRLQTRLGSYETGLDVRLDMLRNALLAGLVEHRAEEGRA